MLNKYELKHETIQLQLKNLVARLQLMCQLMQRAFYHLPLY